MSSCCEDEVVTKGTVLLAPGVVPAGAELMRRAGLASEYMNLPLMVKSGNRTDAQAHNLRMGWLYRRPGYNLAARCDNTYGKHSWGNCGRSPKSNHASGRAIDCGFVKNGHYASFMLWPGALAVARSARIKAPLWSPWNRNIEAWHMELA
jgi:hypothetical protein